MLFSETFDSSSDHPNFPCPFCTKIFDENDEVVEHLGILPFCHDTFVSDEEDEELINNCHYLNDSPIGQKILCLL